MLATSETPAYPPLKPMPPWPEEPRAKPSDSRRGWSIPVIGWLYSTWREVNSAEYSAYCEECSVHFCKQTDYAISALDQRAEWARESRCAPWRPTEPTALCVERALRRTVLYASYRPAAEVLFHPEDPLAYHFLAYDDELAGLTFTTSLSSFGLEVSSEEFGQWFHQGTSIAGIADELRKRVEGGELRLKIPRYPVAGDPPKTPYMWWVFGTCDRVSRYAFGLALLSVFAGFAVLLPGYLFDLSSKFVVPFMVANFALAVAFFFVWQFAAATVYSVRCPACRSRYFAEGFSLDYADCRSCGWTPYSAPR